MIEVRIRFALDRDWRVLSVGDEVEQLLGFPSADFLSGRVALPERIHADDSDLAQWLFDPALAPAAGSFNIRLRQANGRIRCVRGEYARSAGDDGLPVMELRLQDAKSLQRTILDASATVNFRAMMENTDDYIYFKDRNHVFTGASQTLVALCDPAEHWTDLLGQTDYDVFPEAYADIYYRLEKQVFAGEAVAREVQAFLAKDGRQGWVDNRKYPIRDERGEIIGLYGIARDVTEQKLAEAALTASEAKFHSLYESMTEGVALYELIRDATGRPADYRLVDVNPAFATITGLAREPLLGRTGSEIFRTSEPPFLGVYAEVVTSGAPVSFEAEFATLGRNFAISVFSPAPEQFATIFEDISERKMVEREQARLNRELQLLSKCNLTQMRVDSESQMFSDICRLLVEAGGYRMAWVGLAEDDAGKRVRPYAQWGYEGGYLESVEISWDGEREVGRGPTGIAIRSGRTQVNQNILDNPRMTPWRDAAVRCGYQASIALPLIIDSRRVGALMAYSADPNAFGPGEVSLLEELSASLCFGIQSLRTRIQREAAESANLAKSAFLANMSHEIRTPLNAITGMAHLMRKAGVSPDQQQRLDKIEAAGRHLLQIINAILDLSKIEAGKFVLDESDVHVGAVIANVVSMLTEAAEAKHLELRTEVDVPAVPLLGDPTRLQQALLNYAGNAVKFTDKGLVTLAAQVVEEAADSLLLRFEVWDTGIGIAPEAIPKLFSMFEQADNTTTRKYGGTGLGLSITRRLAELMQGSAGVESHLGLGSRFWFTARLKKAQHPMRAVLPDGAAVEGLLAGRYRGRRILLVEDEPINREIAADILGGVGLLIEQAADGAQAFEMAGERDYDLILMDMQMPVMDGLESARRIRRLARHATTPIVAMTANAFADDKVRCFEAGMDDFISKPVEPEVLFATLVRWLAADRRS